MEKNQQSVQMDTQLFYVSNVNIALTEEEIYLVVMTGNAARRYVLSPKHAKRLSLLLPKQIAEYEKQFGALETELVEMKDSGDKPGIGFNKA